ncbi:hypothetical protein [Thiomicrorhabdus sp. Kp2]|uniref:hypothetical protein n=1 Tax=Thiomicrorhabdus sp. Kp2 TaxID=1123518 RepID=UPI0012FE7FE2|nr:hypothetical protein [Thiomicrorhabdus sp. Kp2]
MFVFRDLPHNNRLPYLYLLALGLSLLMPLQKSFASDTKDLTALNFAKYEQFTLSQKEMEWIGERIYQNECASNPKYLTYWGKGEEFPSLGIGHFIWYTGHYQADFQETFPDMVEFVSQTNKPPLWLIKLTPFNAPWRSKTEFDQAWSSSKMTELRNWLLETKGLQAKFIVRQFMQRTNLSLKEIHKKQPAKADKIQNLINQLFGFKEGRFAVVDYANFKGIGSSKEQYNGEQWGLFSVLEEMDVTGLAHKLNMNEIEQKRLLEHFVQSAKSRLSLRVKLSPKKRGEKRWLEGWFERLDGYINNT